MTQTQHTPGKWTLCKTIQAGAVTHWHIAGEKHGSVYPICNHTIEVEPSSDEQLSNARLIAAAPDLLEALQEAVDFADQDSQCLTPHGENMISRWKSAIQKATVQS